MITELQPRVIVLQLTNALFAQLQPFLAGLDITATPQSAWADQEISAHSHVAPYANVEQSTQRLTLRGESDAALVERVSSALDYDVRWQPNEYAPDGFVERVRPLELTNGIVGSAGCPQCRTHFLANHAQIAWACGQTVVLI